MAEILTPAQQQAVRLRGSNLLVSAAAGSGKTKVLVDRLLSYLMDPENPANIDDFLIITYTKAAASELRGKITAKLTERIAEQPDNTHLQRQLQRLYLANISTVHSFCSDLLRQYAYLLDIPADFGVADEIEMQELRQLSVEAVLEQAYGQRNGTFVAFADTQGLGRTDKTIPEIILKIYEAARCHVAPKDWLQNCLMHTIPEEGEDLLQTLWGSYLLQVYRERMDVLSQAMANCAFTAGEIPEFQKAADLLQTEAEAVKALSQRDTWDGICQGLQINFDRISFPPAKKNPAPETSEQIKNVRTACREEIKKLTLIFSESADVVRKDLQGIQDALIGLSDLVLSFDKELSRRKSLRRILDFSDLEQYSLDLLLGKQRSGATAVSREIGSRYREIMVDEYQDSNAVQDAIFSAISGKENKLFMVGDVKQSIYRFRLADPGIFLGKYLNYQEPENAQPCTGRKIMLSCNFRSGAAVLDAVNDVFRYCMSVRLGGLDYGDAEALVEGIPHDALMDAQGNPEPEIELHCAQTTNQTYLVESEQVAQRISELLDGSHFIRGTDGPKPVSPEDIVILLRSPGSVGYFYAEALSRKGISSFSGGGIDLLSTEEIETLVNILRVIQNPRQDIPLISAMANPVFGFTADDLARIRGKKKHSCFFDALSLDSSEKALYFLTFLRNMRLLSETETLTGLLQAIYSYSHVESVYGMLPHGEVRKANLRSFYEMAIHYENSTGRGLPDFLRHLEKQKENGYSLPVENGGSGCVTIMSIHKSKGLEFPVVFLCGLSKGFNKESQRGRVQCDRELGVGLSIVDHEKRVYYPSLPMRAMKVKEAEESLSEELRILYVAMTRAKDHLLMYYSSPYLLSRLKDICGRLPVEGKQLLLRDVSCMGDWVLMAALQRAEAKVLFEAIESQPFVPQIFSQKWLIRFDRYEDIEEGLQRDAKPEMTVSKQPAADDLKMMESLQYRYPYMAATQQASKLTATQIKGRPKDEEVEEGSKVQTAMHKSWRHFGERKTGAVEYGNTMHRILQYISLTHCSSIEEIRSEVEEMVDSNLLTRQEADSANLQGIAAFFASEYGKRLCKASEVYREYKFSILEPVSETGDDTILLQGVVDCFYMEEDGITIIDFKTDSVNEDSLSTAVERYSQQIQTYSKAISRIFAKPIRRRILYFLKSSCSVEVPE